MVLFVSTVSAAMQPTAQACSSLTVQSDKDTYTLGQPVIIAVTFHATLPSCVAPMFVHGYVLTIQVFNAANDEVYSWNHTVPGFVNVTESWTPTSVGDYSINATSYLTIPGNDLMTRGLQAYKVIHVQDPERSMTIEALTLSVIAIVAVAAGYFVFRRKNRTSKSTP